MRIKHRMNHQPPSVQWQTIEEVWVNGRGTVTYRDSEGREIRRQTVQNRTSRDRLERKELMDVLMLTDALLSEPLVPHHFWSLRWDHWGDRAPRMPSFKSRPFTPDGLRSQAHEVIEAEVVSSHPASWPDPHRPGSPPVGIDRGHPVRQIWQTLTHRSRRMMKRLRTAAKAAWTELTR